MAIYICCTLIDILRLKLLEPPVLNGWDKLWTKLVAKFTKKKQCEQAEAAASAQEQEAPSKQDEQ